MLLSNTTFFYFVFGSGDESLLLKMHKAVLTLLLASRLLDQTIRWSRN